MLPLKSLPKALKHAAPGVATHGRSVSNASSVNNGAVVPHTINGLLAANPGVNGLANDEGSSSRPSSSTADAGGDGGEGRASRLAALEAEEKAAREELIVLEEQGFMVREMLADAQRRRKFEEVESLGRNVEDLNGEVERLQGVVARVKKKVEEVYMDSSR